MEKPKILVVASPGNPDIVNETLTHLQKISPRYVPCNVLTEYFADREPRVEILDHVGGESVVLIACVDNDGRHSINDNWMMVLSMLDALSRAGAKFRTAMFPYLPYGRQDRRAGAQSHRTPITAALVPQFLTVAAPKLRHVCAVEPHDAHMEMAFQRGLFFDTVPILRAFLEPLKQLYPDLNKVVVVSPDKGGVERASKLSDLLQLGNPPVHIDKRRLGPGSAKAVQVIGRVEGLDAVIIDDMIDTCGSMCEATRCLKEAGARRIIACTVHGHFNGPAVERLQRAEEIERVLVTPTVWIKPEVRDCGKIQMVPIGHLLAEAIDRLMTRKSIRDTGKTPYVCHTSDVRELRGSKPPRER